MKEIINPSLIIVFGKMIEGMSGTFLHFDYKDSFLYKNKKYKQLSFFPLESVFKIEGGDYHG